MTSLLGAIDYCLQTDGSFRVVGWGLWSADYVDPHFATLDCMLQQGRKHGVGVRVLVDLRQAGVQPKDTAAAVQKWTASIYRPEDKVAILVASSLLKVQMRRVAMIADCELFADEADARAWLRL